MALSVEEVLIVAKPSLPPPTADEVIKAGEMFDRDNRAIEWTLTQLFREFPANTDFYDVSVKTNVLNVLYSTQIRAVNIVARHIVSLGIDPDLRAGKAELVDRVARVQLSGDKIIKFFSFASKYCSWHNPEAYPAYDRNVEACLWYYAKRNRPATFNRYAAYDYAEFVRRVRAFQVQHQLTSFTFKQIDKFLWQWGDTLVNG